MKGGPPGFFHHEAGVKNTNQVSWSFFFFFLFHTAPETFTFCHVNRWHRAECCLSVRLIFGTW